MRTTRRAHLRRNKRGVSGVKQHRMFYSVNWKGNKLKVMAKSQKEALNKVRAFHLATMYK